eukprot:3413129-Rhodomonas_salina.1
MVSFVHFEDAQKRERSPSLARLCPFEQIVGAVLLLARLSQFKLSWNKTQGCTASAPHSPALQISNRTVVVSG